LRENFESAYRTGQLELALIIPPNTDGKGLFADQNTEIAKVQSQAAELLASIREEKLAVKHPWVF
jgi:hypothetical protein